MTNKLYCYVDESGQDTHGEFFIVATIITSKERDTLLQHIEQAEVSSGRNNHKWSQSKTAQKKKYLTAIYSPAILRGSIYYRVTHKERLSYLEQTAVTVAQSLEKYSQYHHITDYRASIIIDGLTDKAKTNIRPLIKQFVRQIEKIAGARDESDAIVRLADSIAGIVRESLDGKQWATDALNRMMKAKIIYRL